MCGAGIVVMGRLAFGVPVPARLAGFVVAVVLTGAAMLAVGAALAAVTPSARSAGAVGTIAFFPMTFLAGLWVPRPLLPDLVRQVGDWTPLGAAARAMQSSLFGSGPTPSALLVLAATTLLGAVLGT